MLCLLDKSFSLQRLIHSLESTPCGRPLQILLYLPLKLVSDQNICPAKLLLPAQEELNIAIFQGLCVVAKFIFVLFNKWFLKKHVCIDIHSIEVDTGMRWMYRIKTSKPFSLFISI
ncbi:hypothetical protein ACOSQ3_012775 [Xanthoceras sorbifolium]